MLYGWVVNFYWNFILNLNSFDKKNSYYYIFMSLCCPVSSKLLFKSKLLYEYYRMYVLFNLLF